MRRNKNINIKGMYRNKEWKVNEIDSKTEIQGMHRNRKVEKLIGIFRKRDKIN